jgi:hypothetical protein
MDRAHNGNYGPCLQRKMIIDVIRVGLHDMVGPIVSGVSVGDVCPHIRFLTIQKNSYPNPFRTGIKASRIMPYGSQVNRTITSNG